MRRPTVRWPRLRRDDGFWREAAREVALVFGAYFLYTATKNLINPKAVLDAFGHAGSVISLESAVGIFVEPSIQQWFVSDFFHGLRFLTYFYTFGFWVTLIGSAAVFFVLRRRLYYRMRRVFLITLALGIAVFAIYPLAPPRMLPSTGFVDAMALFGLNPLDDDNSLLTYNRYAAMPSLHYVWSLLLAVAWMQFGGRWAAVGGFAFQAMILIAIIATANHYVLDAVFAVLLLVVAFKIHGWYERRVESGRGFALSSIRLPSRPEAGGNRDWPDIYDRIGADAGAIAGTW
jgi:hypothetical protein